MLYLGILGYLFLFIIRPWEVLFPSLAPLHFERIYMLGLLFLLFISKEKQYIPNPVNKAVLLFWGAMLIGIPFAYEPGKAWSSAFEYFKLLVFYFVIILVIRDRKQLVGFVIFYIITMFLYEAKSLWEFFMHGRHVYRMGIKRLVGIEHTFGGPNTFAASIVYSLPFWLVLFRVTRQTTHKLLLSLYLPLSMVCIIYTGSRSGMLTLLLFFLLLWVWSKKKLLLAIIIGGFALLTWNLMPETYQLRFESIYRRDIDKSANRAIEIRNIVREKGWELFTRRPIVGVGADNFYAAVQTVGFPEQIRAHNLFVELIAELGLIGFLGFAYLIGCILSNCVVVSKAYKSNKSDFHLSYYYICQACIQVIILLLFNGTFGHNLYRYNWLWIGALSTLSYHFIDQEKQRISPAEPVQGQANLPASTSSD